MELADCYRLLGLRTGASYEDIKASYRRLARRYHPDANPESDQQAKDKFIQLTDAYRRLTVVVQPSETKAAVADPPRAEPETPTVDLTKERGKSERIKPERGKSERSPQAARRVTKVTTDSVQMNRQLKEMTYVKLHQSLRQQRFPRAIALVEGLAQRLPQDSEVRQWQAITYQRFGRYLVTEQQGEKAELYLRKALRTDPHNKALWYEVERDLRRLEQPEIL